MYYNFGYVPASQSWYKKFSKGLEVQRVLQRKYIYSNDSFPNERGLLTYRFDNIDRTIPWKNDILSYLEEKIWADKTINVWKDNKIALFGADIRWENPPYMMGARSYVNWLYWDKPLLFNTYNKELYKVKSDKIQKVHYKIFPVSDTKYYYQTDISWNEWKDPIMLLDSSLEYFNLKIDRIIDNKTKIVTFPIEKKYEIVKFIRMNKFDEKITSFVVLPYYETILELNEWINYISLEYFSFTPQDKFWYYMEWRK